MTVKELFEIWLSEQKLSKKESTLSAYKMKIDKHIIPVIGGYKYDKLTLNILNDFVETKLSQGLSAKYVYDIASLIRSVCKYARKRYSCVDIGEFMNMPKNSNKEDRPMLSCQEQDKLHNYLISNSSKDNVGVLLASATGMRIGEICALKSSDIDIEKRTITVRRTVQRINNAAGDSKTKIIVTSPKSKSSVREIPIPKAIFSAIKALWSASDKYFLTGTENPLDPRTLQYRFKAILKKLNISDVNFHSLRHSFATTCVEIGIDIKTLSELLGHSSVKITLDRYVHTSLRRKTECMDMFSRNFAA